MSEPASKTAIPSDPEEAVTHVVRYMHDTVIHERLDFGVEEYDPVAIAFHRLVSGQRENSRKSALEYWWGVIDRIGIQDFQNRSALLARVAICLLYVDIENVDTLEEQMSWFREMIFKLRR